MASGYVIPLIFTLSLAAALTKILGALIGESRALYVDGLTSIANVVALVGIIYFIRFERIPPDSDHPYGHKRLTLGGILILLLSYSFVGGLSTSKLIHVEPYIISYIALYSAIAGLLLYSVTIALSHKYGGYLATYAIFTLSEILESLTTIVAIIGGIMFSWIIDWCGGLIILSFIVYELTKTSRRFINIISDRAPPKAYVDRIVGYIESKGFKVKDIKLRLVSDQALQGYVTLVPLSNMDIVKAYELAKSVEKDLKNKFNADVFIRVLPS